MGRSGEVRPFKRLSKLYRYVGAGGSSCKDLRWSSCLGPSSGDLVSQWVKTITNCTSDSAIQPGVDREPVEALADAREHKNIS